MLKDRSRTTSSSPPRRVSRRLHRARDGRRLRLHHRKADDHDGGEGAADSRCRKRNNRHVRVTFNYRYSPPRTQVKDILMSGEIGDVLSVDFHWLLNTHHGADYFRRWHSQKKNLRRADGPQGDAPLRPGELVAGRDPELVHRHGKREFYTPKMAKRMGLAEPPRALPHLSGEGQVQLLPGHRRGPGSNRSTSTTRSTTATSATNVCGARTSTSRTR